LPASPSWDLFIVLFFIIAMAYGIMLQRDKIITSIISAYAGLVVASSFGDAVYKFFLGENPVFNSLWIKSNVSLFTVQAVLFVLVMALLVAKSSIGGRSRSMAPIEMFGYSFLYAGLVLSSILSFLPADQLANITNASKFAARITGWHNWWIILPILALIFTGWRRRSSSGDEGE